MNEQRMIDAIELRQEWLDATNTATYEPNDVLDSIDCQPTIDPETLPIVQELQTRLGRLGAFLCYATGGKLSGSNYHVEEMTEAFDAYEKEKMADIEKKLSWYEQAEQEGRLVILPEDDWTWTIRGDIARNIVRANCKAALKEREND